MTLFASVVAVLETARVPVAVIGASALAIHGIARSTYDIDLLATDSTVLDERFWNVLQETGAVCEVRRGDDSDPLRGVVRVTKADERSVDVIVGRHAWQLDAIGRATPHDVHGATVPVVAAADLVLLKLHAGSPQDLWDVAQLLEDGSDVVEDVNARIHQLPAEDRARWDGMRQR